MGNAALCVSEGFSPLPGISLGQQQDTREVLLALCEAKPSQVIVAWTVGISLQMQSRIPCECPVPGAGLLGGEAETSLRAEGRDRRVMRMLRPRL